MAVNTLGDVLRIRFFTYLTNQVGINTVHYQLTNIAGAGPWISPFSSWNAQEALIGPLMVPCISAAAQYLGSAASYIAPTLAPTNESSNSSQAANGTMANTPLPGQVAGIITKNTATPGKGGRGRIYMPFPGIDAITPPVDHPNAAYVALISSFGNALFGGSFTVTIAGLTLTWMSILYKRSAPALPLPLIGKTARARWGTQRRRGDYGRQNGLPF